MHATFNFIFDNNEAATLIFKSLLPEIKNKISKTAIEISKNNNRLILKIKSKDTNSLRAACNSYLRWMITAYNVNRSFDMIKG